MATTDTIDTINANSGIVRRMLARVAARLRAIHERRRSRRALDRLSAHELRDIGLTRSQARAEYRRSHFVD